MNSRSSYFFRLACWSGVVLIALFAVETVSAQNTGGVFGPVVNAGHRSMQYRATWQPGENGARDGFAQRVHYQEAINGDFMWRIMGSVRRTADSDFDADVLQGELTWQLSADGAPWQTGLRFDATLRNGSRPEGGGVHWMNEFALSKTVKVRALVMTGFDVGDRAASGISIKTRGSVMKTLGGGRAVGLELYSTYGTTANWRDLDEQQHQVGPVVSFGRKGGISVYLNWLGGLTDATPDSQFRVWLGQAF